MQDAGSVVCDEEASENRSRSIESSQNILANNSGPNNSLFQHCAICLEAFAVGEEVSWSKILLDCDHTYHKGCIIEWLVYSPGCPCCRKNFIHPNDLTVNNVCLFGAKAAKSKWNKRREKIIAKRAQGDFCLLHGLKFPSKEIEERDSTNNEIGSAVSVIESEEEGKSKVGQNCTSDSRPTP